MKKTTLASAISAGAGGSAVALAFAGAPASVVGVVALVGLLGLVVRAALRIAEREHFARKSSAVRRDLLRFVELENTGPASRPRRRAAGRVRRRGQR